MPLTLKTVNAEFVKRGHNVRLARGSGYFYFWWGEAADWLDKTVSVPKVSDLTMDQWIGEFQRLKKLNSEILKGKSPRRGR